MKDKKILFITGTRADYGKIKSLLLAVQRTKFKLHLFVTGMHLEKKYGYTINEIKKGNFPNVYIFENHSAGYDMDIKLSVTVQGISKYVKSINPDLIVVHGDRLEALSGAIVGAFNNILVGHIEGGEVSGTVDELIRHSISKLSHLHFVSNLEAKKRLLQMGESSDTINVIGSPDIDIMFSDNLPDISSALKYYNVHFHKYSILMFHPVTTELNKLKMQISSIIEILLDENHNFIVIYPNNDSGSEIILNEYNRLKNKKNFKVFPSLRFEYFLTLLKSADYIIGNSSAGIREAPYYNTGSINIGSRQNNRSNQNTIINSDFDPHNLRKAISKVNNLTYEKNTEDFGTGNSDQKFLKIISSDDFWKTSKQKFFIDK